MKRIILLAAFLGILVFQLSAQTKTEKIKELFQTMKIDATMKSMFDNMSAMMQNQSSLYGKTMKDSVGTSKDSIRAMKDSIYKDYVKEEVIEFTKKVMDRDMVGLYDKYFSIEEIQEYINFYKTALGQKTLRLLPEIQKDLMTNMVNKDIPELVAKFKKKAEDVFK